MRYFLLLIPLLLSSCTSIRYITTEHGRMVTENKKPVQILGNPPVACRLVNSNNEYTGFFMYQDDGAIFIDDFGRRTIQLRGDVVCRLLSETR